MLRKYDHISFDLDGTLVHTLPEYRYRLVPEIVKRLGGNIKEKHSIDRFWFESGRDKIIETDFELDIQEFWKLFREMDIPEVRAAHTGAFEDSERTLRKLKGLGKKITIITGVPRYIAELEIAKLNGAPHDFSICIDSDGFKVKPDPKSLLHAMEKSGTNSQRTLYIGNSNEDAYLARNAGVDFIHIERKEHELDLKDIAIATIHSLDELFHKK